MNGGTEVLELRLLLTAASPPPLPAVAANVPVLNSDPSAKARLILDFAGDAANPNWFDGVEDWNVPATPAFSVDADASHFSNADLSAIRHIWAQVAEAYAPFNINVTTVDLPDCQLKDRVDQKVVIGGDGLWTGGIAGGIGTYGGFSSSASNVVYVFSDTSPGNLDIIATECAHEAGHGFGLQHQSLYDSSGQKINEYNPGTDAAAPIIGYNTDAARHVWWVGENSIGQQQNDANVIASATNGFGYKADDHGLADAFNMAGSELTASGLIAPEGDKDGFRFDNTADTVSFRVSVPSIGATLNAQAAITTDADNGTTLASRNTANLGETFTNVSLPKGELRLIVSGTDATAPGQQGYGLAMGDYTVEGLVADPGGPYTVTDGTSITLAAQGPKNLHYSWDFNGDGRPDTTGQYVNFNAANFTGTSTTYAKLTVTDGTGLISTATVAITHVPATLRTVATLGSNAVAGENYFFRILATGWASTAAATWTIDWGDGTTTTRAGGWSYYPPHTYAASGTYATRVVAQLANGSTIAAAGPTVSVVAPPSPDNAWNDANVGVYASDPLGARRRG